MSANVLQPARVHWQVQVFVTFKIGPYMCTYYMTIYLQELDKCKKIGDFYTQSPWSPKGNYSVTQLKIPFSGWVLGLMVYDGDVVSHGSILGGS